MNSYQLTKMTWPEVKEALKTVRLAIIPVGAHEQHGPHMTENCDAALAEEMSIRLAERLHPYAMVAPTVNMGVSIHHIHFPGTITLKPSTLIAVLRDMVWSLQRHGLQKFLFLNAHGGNQSTLNVACTELTHELGAEIYYAKTTGSAKQAMKEHIRSDLYGHSCEREVSEAMYMAPYLIREDKLEKGDIQEGNWRLLRPGKAIQGTYQYDEMTRNGCIGDATQASLKAGEALVNEALEEMNRDLRILIGV